VDDLLVVIAARGVLDHAQEAAALLTGDDLALCSGPARSAERDRPRQRGECDERSADDERGADDACVHASSF
jgi:hypothetical protein